jgi:hypothetical protein
MVITALVVAGFERQDDQQVLGMHGVRTLWTDESVSGFWRAECPNSLVSEGFGVNEESKG